MLSSLDVTKQVNKAIVEEKATIAEEQGPLVPDILRDSTDDYLKKLSNEIALNQAFIQQMEFKNQIELQTQQNESKFQRKPNELDNNKKFLLMAEQKFFKIDDVIQKCSDNERYQRVQKDSLQDIGKKVNNILKIRNERKHIM